jgi:hypothetical protein
MNTLSENITKGTFGELLVQLKLLQFGVQAAPPIKDSGNDLIAIRGESFRAIQVKSRTPPNIQIDNLPRFYHILALVILDPRGAGTNIRLDNCYIYLYEQSDLDDGITTDDKYLLSQERIDVLFS